MVERVEDAEEIVADTFLRAYRDAAQFDPGRGSVTGWLTSICRSRCQERSRRSRRRSRLLREAAVAVDPLPRLAGSRSHAAHSSPRLGMPGGSGGARMRGPFRFRETREIRDVECQQ
jgi:DNA-directed RNA polymerase specialized sigma24 family protein